MLKEKKVKFIKGSLSCSIFLKLIDIGLEEGVLRKE
jgi:hypothetical protein